MTLLSRRNFAAGLAALSLAACSGGADGNAAFILDARADETLAQLYENYPSARDLSEKAAGMLIMPVVTEAGFIAGAAYGKGVLRINGATVDYYTMLKGNFGFQIGGQQYAHILFFMTEDALADFRNGDGWSAGAGVEFATLQGGDGVRADTTTSRSPVVAVVFGQAGLRAEATLEGTKYSRIVP